MKPSKLLATVRPWAVRDIRPGLIIHDRRRSLAAGIAIVVGPVRGDGQVRICRWRGGRQHWSLPTAIGRSQIAPILDWTLLPLTEAKHFAAAAFERNYLVGAMATAQGSAPDAARAAGIDRSNFRRLLLRHGLVQGAPRPKRWKRRAQ